MNNAALIRSIVTKFRADQTGIVALDDILTECVTDGFTFAWDIDRTELGNLLSVAGIQLSAGVLTSPPEDASAYPGSAGYREFQNAARKAMRWKDEPILMVDLIKATNMSGEKVPYVNMKDVLAAIGIRYIPGHGFWKHAIYSDPFTRAISVSCSPRRINGVIPLFRQYGWPLAGRDVQKWSENVTTSRDMAHNASAGNIFIRPIGMGMYVPKDQRGEFPMSANVAERMLALRPDEWVVDSHDLRCFRLAVLMARKGLAELKMGRHQKNRVRSQKLLFTPTKEGASVLLKAARKPAEIF